MGWKTESRGKAALWLREYKELNSDLDEDVLQQLALFALAPHVGKEALQKLFEPDVGSTPFRHRSWFWWNCFRYSGLAPEWDPFVQAKNKGKPMQRCLEIVRGMAHPDDWERLGERLGFPIFRDEAFRPGHYKSTAPELPEAIWTKGGTWQRADPFTQIIVLGHHIDDRDPPRTQAEKKIHPDGVRSIESELYTKIDEDSALQPHAKRRAVEYVRKRVPELAGYEYNTVNYETAAWFFTVPVMDESGWWHTQFREEPPLRKTPWNDWRWFPSEPE